MGLISARCGEVLTRHGGEAQGHEVAIENSGNEWKDDRKLSDGSGEGSVTR